MPRVVAAFGCPRRLQDAIQSGGYEVLEVPGGLPLIREVAGAPFVAIVLTLDESWPEAVDLVRTLRSISRAPILALTHESDPLQRALLLDAGVEDLMAPDVASEEFLARLRARLRDADSGGHVRSFADQAICTGPIEIDRQSMQVRRHGEIIHLSRIEYAILDALAARPGEIVPVQTIADAVWDDQGDRSHAVRVYMSTIRAKLEDDRHHPRYLLTRWGRGYQLVLRAAV